MEILERVNTSNWDAAPDCTEPLESGRILFLEDLPFELTGPEKRFLSPSYLDEGSKNISFRPAAGDINGAKCGGADRAELTSMLQRYHARACSLARAMFPDYGDSLIPGFATFRPAQIAQRATSWRSDDTRLHVDAFPSRPLQGRRILRIFSNVNPSAPRMWRAGEPFEAVASRFLPRVPRQFPGASWMLAQLHITKGQRTPYDHTMLAIHDGMKADVVYQRESPQTSLSIAPGVTWACYTDLVPHAAMSGQFALEQTFHLPVEGMRDPALSPLKVLERMTGRRLV